MSEVELINPEEWRDTMIDPVLEEFQSLFKVDDIAAKRFKRRVALAFPELRYLSVKERLQGFFKLTGQQDFSFDSFLQIFQRSSNDIDETVESDKFLGKHGIHRLFIRNWILLFSFPNVKR